MAVNSVVDDAWVSGACGPPVLARELTERRAGLATLAAQICRSRSLQEDVAEHSYWHPNGFVKLVLEQHEGWGQVRLHVWPRPSDDDDIHDHAWRYESIVVGGDLREVRYREHPNGGPVGEADHAAAAGDPGREMWRHSYGMTGHRRFTLRDPVPVRVVADPVALDWHTGDRSGGAPGHVHRFFAVTAPTVTMLRVGPILLPYSHVYRAESTPRPTLVPRPTSRADAAEWVDHVRTITSG